MMSRAQFFDTFDENSDAVLGAALERKLVGLGLHSLVQELTALYEGAPPESGTLMEILGADRATVLEKGLRALPQAKLVRLTRRPMLLLELQELVLLEGGEYWERLLEEDDELQQAARAIPIPGLREPAPVQRRWFAGAVGGLVVIAAALLLIFRPWQGGPSPSWGWLAEDAFAAASSESEYLRRLAASGSAWSNQRPTTRTAVGQRIEEYLAGCDRLIQAPHDSLSADARVWLVERCRTWRDTLQAELDSLRAGQQSPQQTVANVDAITEKLAAALSNKAGELEA